MTDAFKIEQWANRLSALLDEMDRSGIGEYSTMLHAAIVMGRGVQRALADAIDQVEEMHA